MKRLRKPDKLLFKINYSFDKDQTTRLIYYMMVKTFLIQLLISQEYAVYDLLNISMRSSVSTYTLIARACKIKCF